MDDRFKNGVSHYTIGRAVITIPFPEDCVRCQYCPYLKYEDYAKRHSCRITQEWLLYPFHGVGESCPIEIIEEEKNDRNIPKADEHPIRFKSAKEPV